MKNMTNRLLAILALALSFPAAATEPGLRIVDAWIQEGPPSVPVQAGYLTLENGTSETIRITGVRSPLAERIEIHRSDITDSTATMTRITELPLPPRSKLAFSPGGYHLMIYGTGEPPRAGTTVPLEVTTATGETVRVEASVRRDEDEGGSSGSPDDDDHAHHDHH